MDLNKNLEKYTDLIVNIGLGLHAGDKLAIRMNEHSLPLARLVAKKAYEKGLSEIDLDFLIASCKLFSAVFRSTAVNIARIFAPTSVCITFLGTYELAFCWR